MRLVHLSTADAAGGAERQTLRLHKSLLRQGIDSTLLVGYETRRGAPAVQQLRPGYVGRLRAVIRSWMSDRVARPVFGKPKQGFSFNLLPFDGVLRHPKLQQSDVVCLHWVGRGYIHPETLKALRRPLVWLLPDFFPFTGGCHYPGACQEYLRTCGNCPVLKSNHKRDSSFHQHRTKQSAWDGLNLTVISPSNYLAQCARESSLFRDKQIRVVRVGVDTKIFRPIERSGPRSLLGIPTDSHVIGFGAVRATSDRRKGWAYLAEALQQIARETPRKITLLIFGDELPEAFLGDDIVIRSLGSLADEVSVALAYNAMDVFVVPSIEENLPNAAIEAQACGTPCVGFSIGGMPEAMLAGETGTVAAEVSSDNLARAIKQALQLCSGADVRARCRARVEREFELSTQTAKFADVCREITLPVAP